MLLGLSASMLAPCPWCSTHVRFGWRSLHPDRLDGLLTLLLLEVSCQCLHTVFMLLRQEHLIVHTVFMLLRQEHLIVRAVRAVAKEGQLTRSYLGPLIHAPRQIRQAWLQEHYGFSCRCVRCQEEVSSSTCFARVVHRVALILERGLCRCPGFCPDS